jgi:hypothetical protein
MLPASYRDIHCQKRTEVQWDIGAALGADEGADESTSPQAGISRGGETKGSRSKARFPAIFPSKCGIRGNLEQKAPPAGRKTAGTGAAGAGLAHARAALSDLETAQHS